MTLKQSLEGKNYQSAQYEKSLFDDTNDNKQVASLQAVHKSLTARFKFGFKRLFTRNLYSVDMEVFVTQLYEFVRLANLEQRNFDDNTQDILFNFEKILIRELTKTPSSDLSKLHRNLNSKDMSKMMHAIAVMTIQGNMFIDGVHQNYDYGFIYNTLHMTISRLIEVVQRHMSRREISYKPVNYKQLFELDNRVDTLATISPSRLALLKNIAKQIAQNQITLVTFQIQETMNSAPPKLQAVTV